MLAGPAPERSSAPARIAMLVPDLRGGGAERVQLSLAADFRQRGFRVDLIVMRAFGELLEEVPEGLRLVDLRVPRTRNLLPVLRAWLVRERPDALMAALWPITSIAILARGMAGVPTRVLVSDHNNLIAQHAHRGGLYRCLMAAMMRATYPRADARVAVSAGTAEVVARLSGLDRRNIAVIHNPVAPFPPVAGGFDAEAAWGAPPGTRILTIGTMKPQKNHPLLLRAFARLARLDARLAILGDGEERAATEALAHELGLGGRVRMPGYVANPGPWLASADLFVLSSDYEGFGNVIVEALGAGLPIVSTDCASGPAEILDNGRFGTLVPVGDEHALAQAMESALGCACDRAALVRRAGEFAPEIAAERYLELLLPDQVHPRGRAA